MYVCMYVCMYVMYKLYICQVIDGHTACISFSTQQPDVSVERLLEAIREFQSPVEIIMRQARRCRWMKGGGYEGKGKRKDFDEE